MISHPTLFLLLLWAGAFVAFIPSSEAQPNLDDWKYYQSGNLEILSLASNQINNELYEVVMTFPEVLKLSLGIPTQEAKPLRIILINKKGHELLPLLNYSQEGYTSYFRSLPSYDLLVINLNEFRSFKRSTEVTIQRIGINAGSSSLNIGSVNLEESNYLMQSWENYQEMFTYEITQRYFPLSQQPDWLKLGCLEFFRTYEFFKSSIHLGKPIFPMMNYLLEHGFISEKKFLETDINIVDANWLIRAQSFLIYHYFLVVAGKKEREAFVQYLVDPLPYDSTEFDFKTRFGVEYDDAIARVSKILDRMKFNYLKAPYSKIPRLPTARWETPSPLEYDVISGGALAELNRIQAPDGFRALPNRIQKYLDGNSPEALPYEEAFQNAALANEPDLMKRFAKLAIEKSSTSPAILSYALQEKRKAFPEFPKQPFQKSEVVELSILANQILEKDPTDPEAWQTLLEVCAYSSMPIQFQEDFDHLSKGARVLSSNVQAQYAYSVILKKAARENEGEKRIKKLLSNESLSTGAREHGEWLLKAVF